MDEKRAQAYALMRYGIIAPVICHTLPEGYIQSDYIKEAANQIYTTPDGKQKHYSRNTIERWISEYRKYGFDGLTKQTRKDAGVYRKIDSDIEEQIKYFKSNHPRMPATEIYKQLVENGTITNGSISLSTINRCINKIKDEENFPAKNELRRYERPHINEVWCGDSCVGPKITIEGVKRKIYIMALIDDASRYIVGAIATYNDNFVSLLKLIKTSTSKYGIPNVFNFDNGSAYKNVQMELLAARLSSSIHYCHVRTPIQKAKIERWFRTLRDKWLSFTDLGKMKSLSEIQNSLDEYVLSYNQTIHSSLGKMTPEDRFFSEPNKIRKLKQEDIDKTFLLEIERKVSADCIVSIDSREYEVDFKYANKRITIRYSPDLENMFVLNPDHSLSPIKILNKIDNASIVRNKVYLSDGE